MSPQIKIKWTILYGGVNAFVAYFAYSYCPSAAMAAVIVGLITAIEASVSWGDDNKIAA